MNVQCSWKVSDGRSITDAVFYNRETEEADLEDEINVENCVFLKAPDNCEALYPTVPACQLLICCEPPNQITRISTICEAKVIEIYGHHGEYIKTVFNQPLEETDNLYVYRGDVILNKPLSVCSVKFVNLESQNEMWLFGVKIHTDRVTYSPQNQNASIPFATIQQNLKSMGDTEDKEAFKRFADNLLKVGLSTAFQRSNSASWQAAFGNLPAHLSDSGQNVPNFNELQKTILSNFKNETKMEKNEEKKDFSKSNLESQRYTIDEVENLVSTSTSPVTFLSQSISTQTEEDYKSIEENLKTYVNEQMQAINKRFQEMETKLLCKLDEIESFVKPHGVQNI